MRSETATLRDMSTDITDNGITIHFVGDFIAPRAAAVEMDSALTALLAGADYCAVNFEAPVASDAAPAPKSGPSLSQDAACPALLHRAGFNVFPLANNHIMDYGAEPALHTGELLAKGGQCFGLGRGSGAFAPLYLSKNGITVALLSATELQFGIIHDLWTQSGDTGCAWLLHPLLTDAVSETRRKADFVILVAHAGLEGELLPLPEWRDVYRRFIDTGCDAVIGGHTHTPQGYELWHGKPIFYSLGNFCFPAGIAATRWGHTGECVSLTMTREGLSFALRGTICDNFRLSLMPETDWQKMLSHLQSLLSGDGYIGRVNEMCLRHLADYYKLCSMGGYIHPDSHILKSIVRFLRGRCRAVHMLNNLQCESHRWTFARALRLKDGIR